MNGGKAMISEELFKETEKKIFSYYRNLKEINKLKQRVEVLSRQKEAIEKDIRETNVDIEPEIKAVDYSKERVQSSSANSSYIEAALIKEIEKLERERKDTIQKILDCNARIREIETSTSEMEYVINDLSEEYKRFLELKYKELKALEYIADNLSIGKTTACRRRKEIIENIACELDEIA